MSKAVLVAIMVIAAVTPALAEKGSVDDTEPFPMGKIAGQVEWIRVNCGGRITRYAETAFARSIRQDPQEFSRGFVEGAGLPLGYIRTMSVKGVCAV